MQEEDSASQYKSVYEEKGVAYVEAQQLNQAEEAARYNIEVKRRNS